MIDVVLEAHARAAFAGAPDLVETFHVGGVHDGGSGAAQIFDGGQEDAGDFGVDGFAFVGLAEGADSGALSDRCGLGMPGSFAGDGVRRR